MGVIFQMKSRFLSCSLRASNNHCNAPLAGSQVLLDKIQRVIIITVQLASSAVPQPATSLLYSSILTRYPSAAGFNAKQLSSAYTLSLVQLLHTSLICFISLHLHSPTRSSLGLRYSDLLCSEDGQKDPEVEILSLRRTCDLELSFSLTIRQSSSFSSFKSKRKTTPSLLHTEFHFFPFPTNT